MIKSILNPNGKDWQQYHRETRLPFVGQVGRSGDRLNKRPGRSPDHPITGSPDSSWWNPKVPVWLAVLVIWLAIALPIGAQLQQSGGGGSNASVGAYNATAPSQATLSGGMYNSTLPTLTSGQMGTEQLDSSARQIVVGAGSAGTPAGGVVSIQGVSSGQAVPVSGTVAATQSGTWTVQPGNTANTTAWLVTGTGGTFPATQSGTWTVRTVPLNSCGTTVASSALAAVPTSSTAVFTTTTCVQTIVLNNTTSSALTVTVTDNEGTPVNDIITFSLPAYSQLIQPLGGVAFTSGVKWLASGSGVTGALVGNQ
jgi:hypothetical protein